MSCTVITRSFSSVCAPIAVIAIGVFCSGVLRLVAVTVIVSSEALDSGAPPSGLDAGSAPGSDCAAAMAELAARTAAMER